MTTETRQADTIISAAPRPAGESAAQGLSLPGAMTLSAAILARAGSMDSSAAPSNGDLEEGARSLESVSEVSAETRRNWAAALDMLQEAFEAVRIAEAQNQRLELAAEETRRQYEALIRRLEDRIAALQGRAEAAERRAGEAEAWLERFHAAITENFAPRKSQGGHRGP